ncbi:hypothetical protein AJ88_20855 [Mesorhizobium amorphae CCBAU 01583]|nr:hypothetical protein AJ88_20855 [Mesorhizobium amorphae CCBAU 01583]
MSNDSTETPPARLTVPLKARPAETTMTFSLDVAITATSLFAFTSAPSLIVANASTLITDTSTPGAPAPEPPKAAPAPTPTWLKSLAAATRTDCPAFPGPAMSWLICASAPMNAFVLVSTTLTAAPTATPTEPPPPTEIAKVSTSSFAEAETATPRKPVSTAAVATRFWVSPGSCWTSSPPSWSRSLNWVRPDGVPASRLLAVGWLPPCGSKLDIAWLPA